MARMRLGVAVVLSAAALVGVTACGSGGSSVSDSKIVDALGLKKTSRGYEMDNNPFCAVTQLLHDSGEVSDASDLTGKQFAISSPKGTVGIVVQKPFAPNCERDAKDKLKQLQRQQSKSG
jgi:hypothetical protein